MDDRHGPSSATRPELLAKGPNFGRHHRRVIEASRVDRDQIPAVNRLETKCRRHMPVDRNSWLEVRSVRVTETGILRGGDAGKTEGENEQEGDWTFHCVAYDRSGFEWP